MKNKRDMLTVIGYPKDKYTNKVVRKLIKSGISFTYYHQNELTQQQKERYFELINDAQSATFPLIIDEDKNKTLQLQQVIKGEDT